MNTSTDSGGWRMDEGFYTSGEINRIHACIQNAATSDNFRKSADLFAIRQFFKEIPQAFPLVLNQRLKEFIAQHFGTDYFVVKSIYFDKPPASNWLVPWHQDLTISVKEKADVPGYGPWTVKNRQYAVQPPREILENIFTVRIHLDDTDAGNGALKIIPGSHLNGIQRVTELALTEKDGVVCPVKKGGIMLMKPLLLHSSARSTNERQRRVIHLELSNRLLPQPLQWAERLVIF